MGRDIVGAVVKSALIGCEYSATVRNAFRMYGVEAFSNDLLPADNFPEYHLQGDVRAAIQLRRWDLIVLHIECTAMAVCGNRTYAPNGVATQARLDAIEWSKETVRIALAHSDRVVVENPASVIFPHLRKMGADVQYIQPYEHGHPEQKKTGLALWNLPRITPTNNVYDYMMTLPKRVRERIFHMSPSADRGHERSRFYTGFAYAMASQWVPVL